MAARMSRKKSRSWWPLWLFLLGLLPALWIYHGLFAPLPLPDAGYRLEIRKGSSIAQVMTTMADDGVLPNPLLARLWLRLQPGEKKLHPGVWLLRSPQNTVSALALIINGRMRPASRMTVIEGIRFRDLRHQLLARDDIQHGEVLADAALLQAIGAQETHPEGLFAPDSYDIAAGDTEAKVLRLLYQRQQKILAQEWAGRAPGLPYKTPYEALIMASIVEKETGVARERAEIAGVFVRRLQQGMRLQTDPTVIYGMGPAYDGNLTRADLRRMTPYNTYRINGLPPTPIALPGRAAIHAALHPAAGDALYFVARGDGSHEFTATLDAHNQAVARYQKNRSDDYRSAPAAEAEAP